MPKIRVSVAIPLLTLLFLGVTALVALRPSEPLLFLQVELPEDDPPPDIDQELGTAEIAGRVVDGRGMPLADAQVSTVLRGRPLWTYTDSVGWFRLKEVDEGPMVLHVLNASHRPQSFTTAAGVAPVLLELEHRLGEPETCQQCS